MWFQLKVYIKIPSMKINIFSVNFIKLWENILEHEEDKGKTFSENGKNWKRLGSIKKTNIQKTGRFLTIFEKQSPLKQRLCSNNRTFRKK